MNWFWLGLRNYTDFSGRARRSEYWYFALFYLLIFVGLAIVDVVLGTYSARSQAGLLSTTFWLVTLLPFIALTTRRLHDTGRTGWWQLVGFVPLIGVIVLLVFLVQDGDPDDNDYGSNPKVEPGLS
jgi:uncharacterized membrane protein YhaH (DUF805 family)